MTARTERQETGAEAEGIAHGRVDLRLADIANCIRGAGPVYLQGMRLSGMPEQGYVMLHKKHWIKERIMSTSTHLLVAFLLCMVLCVSPVSAEVLKVPGEHPTIDVAIAIASDGDTILIARGTYEHTTLNINKRLTLASDYVNTKDQTDIDETVIKATPAAKKQWFALE